MKKSVLTTIILIFQIFSSMFGVSGGVYAAAETETSDSAIMRELGGLTVGGEKFDAANYPADEEGTPQLLYLSEYGYGYTADKQVAFGLVLYIYNPAQLNIVQDVRNTVQMKIGNAERYSKYALSVIEGNADKLFYKLRVNFTDEEKTAALAALDKDSRRYEVSSLEFYLEGFNATSFDISPTRVFTYTGYAAGLGENDESTLTNTLSYTETGGTETIPLEVKHTSWRPEGTNGNSEFTQDTIHSVYFAVPKELDKKYDYLNSVQARWIRARTAPIFVTGDNYAYERIYELLLRNAGLLNTSDGNLTTGPDAPFIKKTAPEKFSFSFSGGWSYDWAIGTQATAGGFRDFIKGFGFDSRYTIRDSIILGDFRVKENLPTLYLIKYTGGANAKDFVVTSSEITEMVQYEATQGLFYNDKKVAGKYPSYIFENYDEHFTTQIIAKGEFDKTLNLHSEEVKSTFWEHFIGLTHVENKQDYIELEALKLVGDSDKVESKTAKELSDSLYISERDVQDFKSFYKAKKNNNTIYLLRFAISEYETAETTILKINQKAGVWAYDIRNHNGYLAQTECYLDFDIIDFEYVKEDKSYVIPVSMSPIDIFPELTPPPQYYDFWKYGVSLMMGLILFYVVYKMSRKIFRG